MAHYLQQCRDTLGLKRGADWRAGVDALSLLERKEKATELMLYTGNWLILLPLAVIALCPKEQTGITPLAPSRASMVTSIFVSFLASNAHWARAQYGGVRHTFDFCAAVWMVWQAFLTMLAEATPDTHTCPAYALLAPGVALYMVGWNKHKRSLIVEGMAAHLAYRFCGLMAICFTQASTHPVGGLVLMLLMLVTATLYAVALKMAWGRACFIMLLPGSPNTVP